MSNFTKFTIALVLLIIIFFIAVFVKNYEPPKTNDELIAEATETANKTATTVKDGLASDKADLVSANGDTVKIDYTGISNGEQFDGGTATDYDLVLGSGSFIDGFEDQLVDHKIGDVVQVEVTFPDDYSSADLAGKDATFVTVIKDITKE